MPICASDSPRCRVPSCPAGVRIAHVPAKFPGALWRFSAGHSPGPALSTSARIARRIAAGRFGQRSRRRARSGSRGPGSGGGFLKARTTAPLLLSQLLPGNCLRSGDKAFWFSLSRFESWPGSFLSGVIIPSQSFPNVFSLKALRSAPSGPSDALPGAIALLRFRHHICRVPSCGAGVLACPRCRSPSSASRVTSSEKRKTPPDHK